MKKILITLGLLALMAGCAGRPAQNYGFGPTPTAETARKVVTDHLLFALKDPESVQGLTIGKPVPACYARGPGKRDVCGYRMCVAYNAKNSYGGYVGRKIYSYWMLNGFGTQVFKHNTGCPLTFEDWHGEPPATDANFCAMQPGHEECVRRRVQDRTAEAL